MTSLIRSNYSFIYYEYQFTQYYTRRNLFSILLNQTKLRLYILFTIFRLIWIQTKFCLIPNQLDNVKYNLISVWFNKIRKTLLYDYYCWNNAMKCVNLPRIEWLVRLMSLLWQYFPHYSSLLFSWTGKTSTIRNFESLKLYFINRFELSSHCINYWKLFFHKQIWTVKPLYKLLKAFLAS